MLTFTIEVDWTIDADVVHLLVFSDDLSRWDVKSFKSYLQGQHPENYKESFV